MEAKLKLTAVFQKAEERGYIAFIEKLPRHMLSEEELKNTRFIKESLNLAS